MAGSTCTQSKQAAGSNKNYFYYYKLVKLYLNILSNVVKNKHL